MQNINHNIYQEHYPGNVLKTEHEDGIFKFYTENNVLLTVSVYTDTIIRLRYDTDGFPQSDFSYAICKHFKRKFDKAKMKEDELYYEVITSKVICRIGKKNLKITFLNKKEIVINEDEKGFHWETVPNFGDDIVQMSKRVMPGEHYYGLGDKPTQLNLRGKRLVLWGTDEYGFEKHRDPIYKNIPFYMGLQNNLGYGIFFDNTFRSYFDFASERKQVTSFWADGGEMNYYFIYGPELMSVSEQYTQLTGVPELPPLWSLGFHQCKWSYYPESQVKEITSKFREYEIPCDAIYLDIDYMDGFRCFTWDKEKFPNPKRMVAELKKQGFKTIVIIDPGIKVDKDYWVFKEALEKDYFCKRADGPLMKGKVWPGDCFFPDFTNPEVRAWWADLYKELIEEVGVKGVWNDMNEPALFEVPSKTFPNDVRHDYDGHPCSHRKAHNIYGMQMSRATYHGVKRFAYPDRPFIITRSTYSGGQRYSSGWTGDNIATWEHLWVANIQCQRMSVSGMSFIGSDIGGFTEHPTSELFVRWVQLGLFHPFFRIHSSGDHGDQEPWSFGEEAMLLIKKFIELRYQLLPYIYTTFWQYVNNYTPMLRPIAFIDQKDQHTLYREDEFMIGDAVLTAPVMEPNVQSRMLYLPKGNWYSFWDDTKVKGGTEIMVPAFLDEPPIFIKPGVVLPMYPIMQYVGEYDVEELILHAYFKSGKEESVLYEDKGDGYQYENGAFNLKKFILEGDKNQVQITQFIDGKYSPTYEIYEFIMHGVPYEVGAIIVDGNAINVDNEAQVLEHGRFSFSVPASFKEIILIKEVK